MPKRRTKKRGGEDAATVLAHLRAMHAARVRRYRAKLKKLKQEKAE